MRGTEGKEWKRWTDEMRLGRLHSYIHTHTHTHTYIHSRRAIDRLLYVCLRRFVYLSVYLHVRPNGVHTLTYTHTHTHTHHHFAILQYMRVSP
uniref:Bm517 n=1 Tax=Brugia malayi TaxID=6279 RepID=A0A0J9XX32_BRUMA|nr:Bm517 [Brugia malayi]